MESAYEKEPMLIEKWAKEKGFDLAYIRRKTIVSGKPVKKLWDTRRVTYAVLEKLWKSRDERMFTFPKEVSDNLGGFYVPKKRRTKPDFFERAKACGYIRDSLQ